MTDFRFFPELRPEPISDGLLLGDFDGLPPLAKAALARDMRATRLRPDLDFAEGLRRAQFYAEHPDPVVEERRCALCEGAIRSWDWQVYVDRHGRHAHAVCLRSFRHGIADGWTAVPISRTQP